jgi:hypothetical protein
MMDAIERVARAICDKDGRDADRLLMADEVSQRALPANLSGERQWKAYTVAARAAIEALLEANDEMVAAGLESLQESTGGTVVFIDRDPWLCFRAMLNRALRPLNPQTAK